MQILKTWQWLTSQYISMMLERPLQPILLRQDLLNIWPHPEQGPARGKSLYGVSGTRKNICILSRRSDQEQPLLSVALKVCWSFHPIICLNILKISISFYNIYPKQTPDDTTRIALTLPDCCQNQNMQQSTFNRKYCIFTSTTSINVSVIYSMEERITAF